MLNYLKHGACSTQNTISIRWLISPVFINIFLADFLMQIPSWRSQLFRQSHLISRNNIMYLQRWKQFSKYWLFYFTNSAILCCWCQFKTHECWGVHFFTGKWEKFDPKVKLQPKNCYIKTVWIVLGASKFGSLTL